MLAKGIFSPVLLVLWISCLTFASAAESLKCSVCGMEFKKEAKTAFESTRNGKPVHFCSFTCAERFHKSSKDTPLFILDYENSGRINANDAFFLVNSKNILPELDFDMPPSVVAFSKEESAKKVQTRLKDGQVVKGYDALEKLFK